MDDLYAEQILDHSKHPRHSEALQNPDVHFHDANPLCGDEVDVYMTVKEDVIQDVSAVTQGCAISKAAASLLTEELKGKSLRDVLRLQNPFVYNLLGITLSPVRVKCALLGFFAFKKGILRYLGLQEDVSYDA